MGMDTAVLVYTTFPSVAEAERVGGALVDGQLAACVNILPGMSSIYIWKGERHRDSEVVMLVKTRARLKVKVTEEVRRLHPYENPAVLHLEVSGGSDDFLAWIAAQTGGPA